MSGFSLFELFKTDAEGQLAVLNDGLLRLEREPDDATVVEPLMRAAHSIKGAARIVGLDVIVQLAHAMEDCLVAVQRGKEKIVPARIDQLLRGTDLLAQAAALDEATVAPWSESHGAEIADVAEALRAAPPAAKPASAKSPPPSEPAATPPPPAEQPQPAAPARTPAQPSTAAPADAPRETPPPQRGEPVRVSAERLERIMQIAGEVLVAGRRLQSVRMQATEIKSRLLVAEDALAAVRSTHGLASVERLREELEVPMGELVEARGQVMAHLDAMEELSRRVEELSAALSNAALASRMRPFGDLAAGLPRMVRDVARQLGRKVSFKVTGENVLVDRELLARLEAPLTHLLRNCIDHGVEDPAARVGAGKAEEATVTVGAHHHAGRLLVSVRDDGAGIDAERVRSRAIERGLVPHKLAEGLGTAEVLEFLFLPGFSTASTVTEISGRGVGLDIVQSMAHEVGGGVRIETELGRGTTFVLTLPVAMSVVRAAVVEIAGEPMALPLARLERIVKLDPAAIEPVQGRRQFTLDGGSVGVVDAATVLDLAEPTARDGTVTAVVVGSTQERYGLVVDRLLGEEDLVVRPLDARLGKVPHVSAAAMLERGDPVLIVDIEDLVASLRQMLSEGRVLGAAPRSSQAGPARRRVLVVDDSATVREVERQLLVRAGYDVDTAIDGVDGWNALSAGRYDLLVSDVDMPRMNGIELVRRLRADSRFTALPVVIVSYKDREEDRLRGLEAGATAYLTKGAFQDESFVRMVHDLIGESAE